MLDTVRFALHDYAGVPVAWYVAEPVVLPPATPTKDVAHHAAIIDASGSMSFVMRDTTSMVEKAFTLDEYKDSDMLLSLLSYSSEGDLVVHFERVPAREVMAPGSKHVESIRSIRSRGLTCGSQALEYVKKLIRPGETTAINLHTDGWFNDKSPTLEARRIDRVIAELTPMKNVFVNTIAYGGWADFSILSRIASALSGKCVKAGTVKEVYDALHDTTALLAGRVVPAATVRAEGADYQAFVSVRARRVNGSTTDLTVRGLRPEDDGVVWRFRKVTQEAFGANPAPDVTAARVEDSFGTNRVLYAFARAQLADGRINLAKYALVSTRNRTLLERHARALTMEQRAAMALDLDAMVYDDHPERFSMIHQEKPGLASTKLAITDLCTVLQASREDWTLDLPRFLGSYSKRSTKRIVAVSSQQPVDVRLVPTDDADMVSVSSFEQNDAAATINMLVSRPARLEKLDGTEVKAVAGKKLHGVMRTHNNYTLVGDGAVNAKILPIRIAKKDLFETLVECHVLPASPYAFDRVYEIDLESLPVLPYTTQIWPAVQTARRALTLTVLASILRAAMKAGSAASSEWTEDQLIELGKYHLTAKLNFSPPTTTPYTTRDEGLELGLVDAYTSYKIEIFDTEIAGPSALYAANAYLQRRFVVAVDGVKLEKPTFADLVMTDPKRIVLSEKVLTPKVQAGLGAVDDLMFPIVGDVARFLASGRDSVMLDLPHYGRYELRRDALDDAQKSVDLALDLARAEQRKIAMYVGATGLVPDHWGDLVALDADALTKRFPDLSLEKKQQEGSFFVVDKVPGQHTAIVAVYAEKAYFSTPTGVEAARDLQRRLYGMAAAAAPAPEED
jgi:hypothetical protein